MPALRQGRKTNERRPNETSGKPGGKRSFLLIRSRANGAAPRYQLSQSAALRESEPSDRKRTADPCARLGDRRLDHREHDVVAIASGVTDLENGTVAAHHGTPWGIPANVPVMAPAATLSKMVNVCPSDNVVPTVTARTLFKIVTPPVFTWIRSYPLPAVVPLISTRKLALGDSVSAPV